MVNKFKYTINVVSKAVVAIVLTGMVASSVYASPWFPWMSSTPAPSPTATTGNVDYQAGNAGLPVQVASSSPKDINSMASKVITFLGWVVGVSSGVGLLVGALLYIISAGDPGKTRTAKDAIVYSIVGLAVALLSYGIVTFVLSKKG